MTGLLRSRRITVGARRIEYFEAGTGEPGRPVVMLLSGAGDTAMSWLPLQSRLAATHRVIAFERAGIGCSEIEPTRMTGADGTETGIARQVDGFLDEILGIADALAPGARLILVGHSFGALLSRVLAHRHPDRIAGLVMLDATPDLLGDDPLRRGGYRAYIEATALLRRLVSPAVFGELVAAHIAPYYPGRGPFTRELTDSARRAWRRRVAHLYQHSCVAEMRLVLPLAAQASRELDGVSFPKTIPVRMITSGTYGAGWTRLHERIAARYPDSVHDVTGDRFHNVHMRQVDAVVAAVVAISDRVGA